MGTPPDIGVVRKKGSGGDSTARDTHPSFTLTSRRASPLGGGRLRLERGGCGEEKGRGRMRGGGETQRIHFIY